MVETRRLGNGMAGLGYQETGSDKGASGTRGQCGTQAGNARARLEPSMLEHDQVLPCAISRDPAGFVYINLAPASLSSHLPLSYFNKNILLPRPKRY